MSGWNAGGSSDASSTGAAARSSVGKLVAQRIAANVASIEGVPRELLGGVDREWALAWARKGYDVYACRDDEGVWYLWLATRCVDLGVTSAGATRRPETPRHH